MARPTNTSNSWIGLAIFLLGVGLVVFAFKLAYDLFTVPPSLALDIKFGEPLDINDSLESTYSVLIRVILLIVMTIIGSVVANRGIKLYAASSDPKPPIPKKSKGSEPEGENAPSQPISSSQKRIE